MIPVQINQGGTGATTLTGILIGNGGSPITAVTAPSGTVVGTTDSQTLSNKIISPSSNTIALVEDIGVNINGSGSVLTAGLQAWRQYNYGFTIVSWTIIADVSGSVALDIKKSTYSGYPSTSSITASAAPSLSSAQKNTSSTLTGWTTTVSAGDILEYYVTGVPVSCTKIILQLKVTRT